jgi:hypothetical protein
VRGILIAMTEHFIARLQEVLQLEIYEKENPNRYGAHPLKFVRPAPGICDKFLQR